MPMHTLSVGAKVVPGIISGIVSHLTKGEKDKSLPNSEFSFDIGVKGVKSAIQALSHFTVDDIQAYTRRKVPAPPWIRLDDVAIPDSFLDIAAKHLNAQLGPLGIAEVGGEKWWQWRADEQGSLKAQWIDKHSSHGARRGKKATRILFFIHGGAYYFGSVDEHRYQIQRHAKELKARAFAPQYRLAPQYPFPCALQDLLAAYLYLLQDYDAKQIIISGDSAGGGLATSLLLILRDQGLPLPAAGILLSPWIDLTHSFPSVADEGNGDYIPIQGFQHRPSLAWPAATIKEQTHLNGSRPSWIPNHVSPDHVLPTIDVDGKRTEIRDQIQPYAANFLLPNPLVSPVFAPTLGGLCPLLVQAGGSELLCDEIVYFAHKAANPTAYLGNSQLLERYGITREQEAEMQARYPPTKVQLQVWDHMCHVPHVLGWTTAAKWMHRAVGQFGEWAYTNALEDVSTAVGTAGCESLSGSRHSSTSSLSTRRTNSYVSKTETGQETEKIGTTPLPPFVDNMIRQRVSYTGHITPLEPVSSIAALNLSPDSIGGPKEIPVGRWRARHDAFEKKYHNELEKIAKERVMAEGDGLPAGYEGEKPQSTALIRRWVGMQRMER